MKAVKINITRYESDLQPGWVECELIDYAGNRWIFNEKVPIVTTENLSEKSGYPRPGVIACKILRRRKDNKGREIVTIDTEKPWGVESQDGITRFDVFKGQIVKIDG